MMANVNENIESLKYEIIAMLEGRRVTAKTIVRDCQPDCQPIILFENDFIDYSRHGDIEIDIIYSREQVTI